MLPGITVAIAFLLALRGLSQTVLPLTNAGAIHQLPLAEARKQRPVDLSAVVTYSDRVGALFVAGQNDFATMP